MDNILKVVGILLSLVILCGVALAVTTGEFALAIALAVIPCIAFGFRKLLQLEGRVHAVERKISGNSHESSDKN